MNVNFWQGKKVLVTGHTGFKGGWLSTILKEFGAQVIGVSLQPPSDPNFYSIVDLKDKITSLEQDIRDFDKLNQIINHYKPEIIFHLAAQSLVRASYTNPLETYTTNVVGTLNLLEMFRTNKFIKCLVNVTSDKCYENKEWFWGYREVDRLGGYDPYSNSKACSELVSSAYMKSFINQESERGLATARAGNVIGGGDWAKDRLIPDIITNALENKVIFIRNPHAMRPWQHVMEPLSGYIKLAENLYTDPNNYQGAWNFGPDERSDKDVRWIVKEVLKHPKLSGEWQERNENYLHEAGVLKLDSSKARKWLNWRAKWSIETAIKKTIEWYVACSENLDMYKMTCAQISDYFDN